MTFFKLLLLIASLGITGWSVRYLFSNYESRGSRFEEYFQTFLAGFGFVSIVLFFIALAGIFDLKVIAGFLLLPTALYIAKCFRKSDFRALQITRYLFFCLILGCTTFGLGKIAKPFESLIQADDASVYIGAAFKLASSGNLTYEDPLVLQMSPQERSQIFNNRFVTDTTGEKIRFPGGVRLIDSSIGKVVFSFYHMFPIWLATGIETLGEESFLYVLSIFLALKLICLFLLGRLLGGWLLGIAAAFASFFFYPEMYFALMPTSELLAETLFLSGLWIFISGIKSQQFLNPVQQCLVGLLWGALFLCRFEALYMMSITLVLIFTLIPSFSMNLFRWRILILQLIFFSFVALYYQIFRGEYLSVLTSTLFHRSQTIAHLAIGVVYPLAQFVQNNPLTGSFAFLILTALVMVAIWRWILCEGHSQRLWIKAGVGILLVMIMLSPLFAPWVSFARFVRHVGWMSIYFSLPILITLFVGILFYFCKDFRKQSRTADWALCILFLLPALIFLFRPMVHVEQPWGTRKFVPMIFSLFFLLSFSGWQDYLKVSFSKSKLHPKTAFCILTSLTIIFFAGRSLYLLTDNLFADLVLQTRNLTEPIPKNALIVIPESWAGIHLQMPLQYLQKYDTMLLPVEKSRDHHLLPSAKSFLERQIKQRPVRVLLKSTEDPPRLLRNSFNLNLDSKAKFAFLYVPRIKGMVFPDKSERSNLDVSVFSLTSRDAAHNDELGINYDDPNVTFVNFFDKENGFRWTQERSTIQDFVFRVDSKPALARISTCSLPPDSKEVRLLINDQFAVPYSGREGNDIIFDIDQTSVPEISSLTILSNTFIPSENGMSLDPRRLGICFSSLRLQSMK